MSNNEQLSDFAIVKRSGRHSSDWPERRAKLRERAAALGLYGPDNRDEEYRSLPA